MTDHQRPADRRSVLRGIGIVAAAGGLAACSKENVDSAKSAATQLGSSASSGASQAAGSVSSAASSVSSSVAADASTVPVSKVPVGSGYIDAAARAIVSQPTAGQFKAFTVICTHQGCPITRIDGDAAICPCHGSAFSLQDGSVLNGPADKPLAEKSVAVHGADLKIS